MSVQDRQSVSVVIPTRNRPEMVVRAVASALAQTHAPSEVIVVVDGPEAGNEQASTRAALDAVAHPALRVIALPASVGGGEARNVGVRAASGAWIAFLDDDDLWLPGKLAAQLAFARSLGEAVQPVLSCRVLARSPEWEEVWPREPYRAGQPLAEYLFCRKGWRSGAALLQTSTLVAPRSLLLAVPFTPGLRKHQDWDWLLRAAARPGVEVHHVSAEPLAVFHVEGQRASVGRVPDWRFSLQWATSLRHLFSHQAWSGFVATECAAQAGNAPVRDRLVLLWAALSGGIRRKEHWLRLLAFLVISQRLRRRLRDLQRRLKTPAVA